MKIHSLAFTRPVRIKGDQLHSLSSSTEVGRMGGRKNVVIDADEQARFVEVTIEGVTEVVIPMTNVDWFKPIPTDVKVAQVAKK